MWAVFQTVPYEHIHVGAVIGTQPAHEIPEIHFHEHTPVRLYLLLAYIGVTASSEDILQILTVVYRDDVVSQRTITENVASRVALLTDVVAVDIHDRKYPKAGNLF